MATYDTPENGRTRLTRRTLESLCETVDWSKHRLMVSDNGSCDATRALYMAFSDIISKVFYNGENLGTAAALNLCWRHREPDEAVCKIDNDVVIRKSGWADMIELAFQKSPKLGICALKRKDLDEWPLGTNPEYRSRLRPLPHTRGEQWLILEIVKHAMGTCQVFRPELLDKIGYLVQPGLYGFDDSLAAVRCSVAGYNSAFLHGVEIDHIDPGGNEHTTWKQKYAGKQMSAYHEMVKGYLGGTLDIYYDGGFDETETAN